MSGHSYKGSSATVQAVALPPGPVIAKVDDDTFSITATLPLPVQWGIYDHWPAAPGDNADQILGNVTDYEVPGPGTTWTIAGLDAPGNNFTTGPSNSLPLP